MRFLDDDPVTLKLVQSAKKPPASVPVVVVSSGVSDATVKLVVSGAAAKAVQVEPAEALSAPGALVTFTVSVGADSKPGAGKLVAIGSDGSIARRAIAVVDLNEAAPLPPPSSVALRGTQYWPFSDESRVDSVRIVAADRADADVGQVAGPNGSAIVHYKGGELSVVRGPRAGEYSGNVDLAPGADDGDATVTVQVRHFFVYPLVVLVIGLVLIGLYDRRNRRTRPRRELEIRLTRMQEKAQAAHDESAQAVLNGLSQIPDGIRPEPVLARASDSAPDSELILDGFCRDALVAWDSSLTDEERDIWKAPEGSAFVAIEGTLDAYEDYLSNAELLAEKVRSYLATAAVHANKVLHSGLMAACLEALRGDDLTNPQALERLGAELKAVFTSIDRAKNLYETAKRHDADPPHDGPFTKFMERIAGADDDAQLEELAKAVTAAVQPAEPHAAATTALADEAIRNIGTPRHGTLQFVSQDEGWDLPMPTSTRLRTLSKPRWETWSAVLGDRHVSAMDLDGQVVIPATTAIQHQLEDYGGTQALPDQLVSADFVGFVADSDQVEASDPESLPDVTTPVPPPPPSPNSGKLAEKLKRSNRWYSMIAGTIVALSGMAALYVGDTDFGASWGDYLKVLLWGVTVGEGTQLIRQFFVPSASA